MKRLLLLTLVLIVIVAATAKAQTFSVMYNFGSNTGDPYSPKLSGIIAQGRDGNLYTTAPGGGANNYGAVFKMTPAGSVTVVNSFKGGALGETPEGGLTLGTDGNLYGTTFAGGISNFGTVFRVTPSGNLTVLYEFTHGSDGAQPNAPPIQGTDGNFYGISTGGYLGGYGSIYKITSSGKFTALHQFDNTHGAGSSVPLIQGTDGNFYGTCFGGGKNGWGVVFKISPAGKFTVLYNFDFTNGAYPSGPLVQGSDGSFYGTTNNGGTASSGVVFKVTPTGKYTVLYAFCSVTNCADGGSPEAGLVQATDGNFYGVNPYGGNFGSNFCNAGCGTVFDISPTGNYSVLYGFVNDGTTGMAASVLPFQHTNGVIYGDTEQGGTGNVTPCTYRNCGVFYNWSANLPPFVSFLPPQSPARVGKVIGFLGQGFTGATGVSFNGTAAGFNVVSDTYLTATVPSGATTGSVVVTTPGGTLTSNKVFRVTPVILSFNPASGKVGTPVQITGTSFTGTTKVTFGGVKATLFTVNSDTQVTATVPTGAKTGHIAITTPGGTAISSGVFTVTQVGPRTMPNILLRSNRPSSGC